MIEKDANRLIVRYLTQETSPAEEQELLNWILQTEANLRLFRSVKDDFDLWQSDMLIKSSNVAEEWEKLLRRIKSITPPTVPHQKQSVAVNELSLYNNH